MGTQQLSGLFSLPVRTVESLSVLTPQGLFLGYCFLPKGAN